MWRSPQGSSWGGSVIVTPRDLYSSWRRSTSSTSQPTLARYWRSCWFNVIAPYRHQKSTKWRKSRSSSASAVRTTTQSWASPVGDVSSTRQPRFVRKNDTARRVPGRS